jgi:putative oxidoreductase
MSSLYQNFDLTNEFNILRIICGLFFIPHLVTKTTGLQQAFAAYRDFRFHPPEFWVYAAIAIEIIVSVGLVFGIYTRYVALLAAAFLLAATFGVYRFSKGRWLWNVGGYEYPLFWAICCIVVAIHG